MFNESDPKVILSWSKEGKDVRYWESHAQRAFRKQALEASSAIRSNGKRKGYKVGKEAEVKAKVERTRKGEIISKNRRHISNSLTRIR